MSSNFTNNVCNKLLSEKRNKEYMNIVNSVKSNSDEVKSIIKYIDGLDKKLKDILVCICKYCLYNSEGDILLAQLILDTLKINYIKKIPKKFGDFSEFKTNRDFIQALYNYNNNMDLSIVESKDYKTLDVLTEDYSYRHQIAFNEEDEEYSDEYKGDEFLDLINENINIPDISKIISGLSGRKDKYDKIKEQEDTDLNEEKEQTREYMLERINEEVSDEQDDENNIFYYSALFNRHKDDIPYLKIITNENQEEIDKLTDEQIEEAYDHFAQIIDSLDPITEQIEHYRSILIQKVESKLDYNDELDEDEEYDTTVKIINEYILQVLSLERKTVDVDKVGEIGLYQYLLNVFKVFSRLLMRSILDVINKGIDITGLFDKFKGVDLTDIVIANPKDNSRFYTNVKEKYEIAFNVKKPKVSDLIAIKLKKETVAISNDTKDIDPLKVFVVPNSLRKHREKKGIKYQTIDVYGVKLSID